MPWKYIPYTFTKSTDNPLGYFDSRPSFSYGCRTILWIGARRIGKTFSGKKVALKKCQPSDTFKFVWLRDSDKAREKLSQNNGAKFFSDIAKKCKFKDLNGYIKGETIYAFGRVVGYLMPSSTFQNYKGNDFEDIQLIIFDEFIAEKGTKYDSERAWKIINSMFTIASTRKNVKIIMMANALDRGDSFLQFLGVKIQDYGIYINREKDVCIHYCDDHPQFRKDRENSVIGKLIKGTEFEENLFNNKFADDTKQFYDKKPPKTDLLFIAHSNDNSVRVFYDENGMLYVGKDSNTETRQNLRFVSNFKAVNTKLSLVPETFKNALKNGVETGNIRYQNAFCKNVVIDFLEKR